MQYVMQLTLFNHLVLLFILSDFTTFNDYFAAFPTVLEILAHWENHASYLEK